MRKIADGRRVDDESAGRMPAVGDSGMRCGDVRCVDAMRRTHRAGASWSMIAAVRAAAVLGVEAFEITVEVHLAPGLPQFTVVGLPAGALKESRERVAAALANSGFPIPPRRIVVNLAPADIRKDGSALDLPIAIGILSALDVVPASAADRFAFVGELALDGALRAVRGALPMALWAARAGCRLVVPTANLPELSRLRGGMLAAPDSLAELIGWLQRDAVPMAAPVAFGAPRPIGDDLAQVAGQPVARRALEIAAAGGHNVLFVGPPGVGKTMLARRMPSILPALDEDEVLDVLAVRSVAGLPYDPDSAVARPFRAPHHTVSAAALVGGHAPPRPGEVTLAHHGVLFLDELLEFPRHVLDALRQPLEDGHVLISRASGAIVFPSRFTLVAAANPCPCGRAGDPTATCHCAPAEVERYAARLSGPLIDRLDMRIPVGGVAPRDLASGATSESSEAVRGRVEAARARQRARNAALGGPRSAPANADRWMDQSSELRPEARALLVGAAERIGLSARGFYRVLRVARTIADLDGERAVQAPHVAESLRFRAADQRCTVRPGGGIGASPQAARATGGAENR